jgi:hypothetical protein
MSHLTPAHAAVIQSELAHDPAAMGYHRRNMPGTLKTARSLAVLLTLREVIKNPEPRGTITRPITRADIIKAMENPQVAAASAAGFLTRQEAVVEAGIDLTMPDPYYVAETTNPSRLEVITKALPEPIDTITAAELGEILQAAAQLTQKGSHERAATRNPPG